MKNFKTVSRIALVGLLCFSSLRAMDMGTNFWNIGWGIWGDCFKEGTNFSTTTNPWNEQFLQDLKTYRNLRFMDWSQTNNSNVVNWSERVSKTAAQTDGVAYEWQIDLCNRMNADMWQTIPAKASDDYIRLLATLIKNTLNPNLKCYIEYSNETWNWGFEQAAYCRDMGVTMGLQGDQYEAANRYHVVGALKVFRIFEEVYGGQSSRLVKVVAGQTGQTWLCGVHLSVLDDAKLNPTGIKADAYAVAPYIGHGVRGDAPDACDQLIALIPATVKADIAVRDMVKAKGMRFIAYEGGQHITDYSTSSGNGSNIANADPKMYNVYIKLFDAYKDIVDLFEHYCHTGVWDGKGSWGAMQHTGDPVSTSHKWRAIIDWVSNNSVAVKTLPSITEQPLDFTASVGSLAQFSVNVKGSSLITYQWRKNGTALPNGFNATLTIPNVQLTDNGAKISVVATNSYGKATSRDAILTVTQYSGLRIGRAVNSPIIDGIEDALWQSATALPIVNTILGTSSSQADVSGQFKTLWDANNLYVLIKVTDNVASTSAAVSYQNDGVEVYVDGDNSKGTTYDANDIQYRLVRGKSTIESSGSGKANNVVFAQTENASGYIVELRFPWATIGSVAQSSKLVGLEVHITDNDGTPERKTILAWAGSADDAWSTPAVFGTAQLADGSTALSQLEKASAQNPIKLTSAFVANIIGSSDILHNEISSVGVYTPDGRLAWQSIRGSNKYIAPTLRAGSFICRVVMINGSSQSIAFVYKD